MGFIKHGHIDVMVNMNDTALKQVTTKKPLEVVVDEDISFRPQEIHVATRGRAALERVSAFLVDIKLTNTENMNGTK